MKKGSSEYDQAAYDLTSEFQTKDRSRMIEVDAESKKLALEIEELRQKYFKGSLSLKNEIMEKAADYNSLISEFKDLNKPIAKFVRLHNKIAKQVTIIKNNKS